MTSISIGLGISSLHDHGTPKATLTLVRDEQTKLHSRAASHSLPHALVARAKLVLWSAGKWRQRFIEHPLGRTLRGVVSGPATPLRGRADCRLAQAHHFPQARTGAFGRLPRPAAFPSPPCIACFDPLRCHPIAAAALGCPPIPSSTRLSLDHCKNPAGIRCRRPATPFSRLPKILK